MLLQKCSCRNFNASLNLLYLKEKLCRVCVSQLGFLWFQVRLSPSDRGQDLSKDVPYRSGWESLRLNRNFRQLARAVLCKGEPGSGDAHQPRQLGTAPEEALREAEFTRTGTGKTNSSA